MAGNESVDAPGEGFKEAFLVFGHGCRQVLCCRPDLQDPLHFIVLHHAGPQQLSQLAGGKAARHIHLPQPVLGHDKALRLKQVRNGRCLDMGDAMDVAPHHHRSGQSGQLQLPVEHRQLLAHSVLQPRHTACDAYCCNKQQADYQARRNPDPQRQFLPLRGIHSDPRHHSISSSSAHCLIAAPIYVDAA